MTSKTMKKALTYRVLSLLATATTAFAMTGSLGAALGMGMVDGFFKFGLYAAHEAAWEKLDGAGDADDDDSGGFCGSGEWAGCEA